MERSERSSVTAETPKTKESSVFPKIEGLSEKVNEAKNTLLEQEQFFFAEQVLKTLESFIHFLSPDLRLLRLFLPLLMVTLLNGCMYSPKYEDYYQEAPEAVRYQDQHTRKNRIVALTGTSNLDQSSKAIIGSGINPCQRSRILENMETMIKEISDEDFDKYLSLCEKAKQVCGIMNPDRYSPTLLEELVKNYESREYNADKEQVMVFTSRKDIEKTFDIQALSVDSYRVEELVPYYKVLLIETDSINELTTHLDRLQNNGILEDRRLKGALVIGHGDQDEVENGLNMNNMSVLSRLNRLWVPDKKSFFVYFSCLSAEGGHEENNMVNSTAVVCPIPMVYGCTTIVEDVEFQIDKNGELVPGSLELSTFFSFGNDTFTANRTSAVRLQAQRLQTLMKKEQQCAADLSFFQKAVDAGIASPYDISILCTQNIPPETYSTLIAAGWNRHEFLYHKDIFLSYARALEYAEAGVRGRSGMLKLYNANISPNEIRMVRAATRARSLTENFSHPDALIGLKRANVYPIDLVPYLQRGETALSKIIHEVATSKALASSQSGMGVNVATR